VFTGRDTSDPITVIEIPTNCLDELSMECNLRTPAEFSLHFRRIDRMAAIMSRPILSETHAIFKLVEGYTACAATAAQIASTNSKLVRSSVVPML
jgi:hypothetical protein